MNHRSVIRVEHLAMVQLRRGFAYGSMKGKVPIVEWFLGACEGKLPQGGCGLVDEMDQVGYIEFVNSIQPERNRLVLLSAEPIEEGNL